MGGLSRQNQLKRVETVEYNLTLSIADNSAAKMGYASSISLLIWTSVWLSSPGKHVQFLISRHYKPFSYLVCIYRKGRNQAQVS